MRAVLAMLALGALAGTAVADGFISTASIFYLGVSARVLGMGGAFIALADDEAAAFYNPAGLAGSKQTEFASLLTRPFWEFTYTAAGFSLENWGGYVTLLDSGALDKYDIHGNSVGTMRYTSLGAIGGVGYRASTELSLGLQVKGYGTVFPTQAVGFSLSPSILWHRGSISVGIIWQNLINIPIRYYDGHEEPWVQDVAVGLAWDMGEGTLLVDFTEQLITRGDISNMRIGYENRRFYPLVLRAGTNRDGVSFGLSGYWNDLRFDFAYLLHFALPDTYVFSVSYNWSP